MPRSTVTLREQTRSLCTWERKRTALPLSAQAAGASRSLTPRAEALRAGQRNRTPPLIERAEDSTLLFLAFLVAALQSSLQDVCRRWRRFDPRIVMSLTYNPSESDLTRMLERSK
ncbi:uncharacterized protein LOC143435088 [Arvicanthis niloticus]|uniref:uncharacterized protein LOC143309468 n=1 Tax=Arvicanthis niloticus TaxID=61156 RepID=UPI00402B8793